MSRAIVGAYLLRDRRRPGPLLTLKNVEILFLRITGVLRVHATNEGLEVRRDRLTSRLGFPAPEELESSTMPADQRGWLDNDQCTAPVEPTGEPDQGKARRRHCPSGFDLAPLVQGQLFAQKRFSAARLAGERRRSMK
jgi:hypothetical protein